MKPEIGEFYGKLFDPFKLLNSVKNKGRFTRGPTFVSAQILNITRVNTYLSEPKMFRTKSVHEKGIAVYITHIFSASPAVFR